MCRYALPAVEVWGELLDRWIKDDGAIGGEFSLVIDFSDVNSPEVTIDPPPEYIPYEEITG